MAICNSAAALIHSSPNALQAGINEVSQQPCEVGGCHHPTAVGTMRAPGIRGLEQSCWDLTQNLGI